MINVFKVILMIALVTVLLYIVQNLSINTVSNVKLAIFQQMENATRAIVSKAINQMELINVILINLYKQVNVNHQLLL